MRRLRSLFLALAVVAVGAITVPGLTADPQLPLSNAADDEALVEIHLADRTAIDPLLDMGLDLAEYVREEPGGIVTAAFVTPAERAFLETLGYVFGRTVEDRSTWEARKRERQDAMADEQAAQGVAEEGLEAEIPGVIPSLAPSMSASTADAGPGEEEPPGEVTIMRADYFVHRSGRFLSVEARTALGTNSGGPTMAVSWAEDGGAYGTATTMSKFTDAGAYMYHRTLLRMGAAGSTTPVPHMVRVASSTGEFAEDEVRTWPGEDLPPYAEEYLTGFHTHYMDPVEVYDRINDLAAEFPNISEIMDLPYQTNGYQRKAMAVMGASTAGGSPSDTSRAVLLISQAWGHEGGNDVQAEFLPSASATTTIAVTGSKVTVNLGVGATAAQVVAAINADAAASALVTAYTYAGNAGGGAVLPIATTNLSDLLEAPATIPRGPFQPQVIRIGKVRDGSKVGVFLFCQQHAREWATPLTCVETAERLLRNYAIDPKTQEMVDNLDIFILPSVNPDGSLYSFYDFASQRKNMTRYCPLTATSGMPTSRDSWGVDLNRNNTVGTLFDGFSGASTSCTNELYTGPGEASEPEIQNEHWLVDTMTNIKFSNNIHSYGGYFMWAPGAYKTPGRVTLPAPNIGIEGYFFAGAEKILTRIKESRGTVILPGRTGPVADVLYSAAGNSADDQWYRKNIIAYSFETGADLFSSTETGTSQSAVGFMPNYATEGSHEANEFAAGNYGLLETALDYAYDDEPPVANVSPDGAFSQTPIDATFTWGNEPSVIYYTMDGSTPTLESPTWNARGPRQPGEWFHFDQTTTLKWIAEDIRGNMGEVRSARFVVDTTAPTTTAALSPPYDGLYVEPSVTLTADDDVAGGGAGVDRTEYRINGGDWTTYTGPFTITSDGDHTLEFRSVDLAGNTEEIGALSFQARACTIRGTDGNETLTGTGGDDVICAMGGKDIVRALAGNDLILSGGGTDTVYGGPGDDVIFGEGADDHLRGDAGNDVLRGGPGYDRLVGGTGTDTCSVDEGGGKRQTCEA